MMIELIAVMEDEDARLSDRITCAHKLRSLADEELRKLCLINRRVNDTDRLIKEYQERGGEIKIIVDEKKIDAKIKTDIFVEKKQREVIVKANFSF